MKERLLFVDDDESGGRSASTSRIVEQHGGFIEVRNLEPGVAFEVLSA
jgi:hypothetical protein